MGTTECNEFLNRIDEWMEGERSSGAENHLRDCPECRGVVEDLSAIQRSARSWGEAEPEPPARVWISLRAQLEKEGLIRAANPGWIHALTHWLDGVFSGVPRPALAGAYLIGLVAISMAWGGFGGRVQNEWMNGEQMTTAPLSASLDTAEQSAISNIADSNPAVTASLHQNLAIVDNYIALCEKSVREEPENETARDYLYEAYEQKADLLAQMTERGVNGR